MLNFAPGAVLVQLMPEPFPTEAERGAKKMVCNHFDGCFRQKLKHQSIE